MDVAARAQARIDAIVREEGVSVQEARRRTDAEVMEKVHTFYFAGYGKEREEC